MSDKPTIAAPQYTLIEAVATSLALAQRALADVHTLARAPGPPGPQGEDGIKGDSGTAGRDGKDAVQMTMRGTFKEETEYRFFDVVVTGGSSFVALTDKPGACPGAGWQLIASAGRAGRPGIKGDRGEAGPQGKAAPVIVKWETDRTRYCVVPVMSDGSKAPAIELRDLFEQFQIEAR